jgi:hypothetical protein
MVSFILSSSKIPTMSSVCIFKTIIIYVIYYTPNIAVMSTSNNYEQLGN